MVGIPKFASKPPVRRRCVDELVYSANVLTDPGFELQLNAWGSGPNLANDMPHYTVRVGFGGIPLRWPESSDANSSNDPQAGNRSYWVQDFSNWVDSRRWLISTANPRSGTYHARKVMTTAALYGGGDTNGTLYADQRTRCGAEGDGTSADLYTARVEAGDTVEWSAHLMADVLTATPTLTMVMDFLDTDWTFNFGGTGLSGYTEASFNLTGSYARYSISTTAPSGAHAVLCYLWVDHDRSNQTVVDLDDTAVAVIAAP
jgi:hypothetical protein